MENSIPFLSKVPNLMSINDHLIYRPGIRQTSHVKLIVFPTRFSTGIDIIMSLNIDAPKMSETPSGHESTPKQMAIPSFRHEVANTTYSMQNQYNKASEHAAIHSAWTSQRQGKYTEAIILYKQSLQMDLGSSLKAAILFNIGSCYMGLKEYLVALSVYERLNHSCDQILQLNIIICQIKLGMNPQISLEYHHAVDPIYQGRLRVLASKLGHQVTQVPQVVGVNLPPGPIISLMQQAALTDDNSSRMVKLKIISLSRGFGNDSSVALHLANN